MSQEAIAQLLESVRESIARAVSMSGAHPDERLLKRVLAYLWSAHDELESITERPSRHQLLAELCAGDADGAK